MSLSLAFHLGLWNAWILEVLALAGNAPHLLVSRGARAKLFCLHRSVGPRRFVILLPGMGGDGWRHSKKVGGTQPWFSPTMNEQEALTILTEAQMRSPVRLS